MLFCQWALGLLMLKGKQYKTTHGLPPTGVFCLWQIVIKCFLMDCSLNVDCGAPCIQWMANWGTESWVTGEFYHVSVSMWHSNIYLKTFITSHPPLVTDECWGARRHGTRTPWRQSWGPHNEATHFLVVVCEKNIDRNCVFSYRLHRQQTRCSPASVQGCIAPLFMHYIEIFPHQTISRLMRFCLA